MRRTPMKDKLVYVAHPYGNLKDNKLKIDAIMEQLVFDDPTNVYVSPIHNYGFKYLEGDEYKKGIDVCLRLLGKCDALILAGDWKNSRGCNNKYVFAVENGIPIYTLKTWKMIVVDKVKNLDNELNERLDEAVEDIKEKGLVNVLNMFLGKAENREKELIKK